jgi:hypothetical protein
MTRSRRLRSSSAITLVTLTARSLAEEYLDSDKVLTRLLQRVGAYS